MTPIQAAHEMKIPGDILPKIYRYSNKETQNSILQALNKDLYCEQFKSIRTNKIINRIECMDPKWLESTRLGLGVQKISDVIKHGLGILQRDNVHLTDEQRECAFSAAANNLGDHEIMEWIQPNKLSSVFYSKECIRNAMLAAAQNGNLPSVKHWQPFCNENTISTAIMAAARKGHKKIVLFLMSFKTLKNTSLFEELLVLAAGHGWEKLVEDTLKKLEPHCIPNARCEGAFAAAKNGHVKLAEDLLRSPLLGLHFSAYFNLAINAKLFPVIEVFAKHPQYISSWDRGHVVICVALHGKPDLLPLLLIRSEKRLLSGTKYYEISEVARGMAVVAICKQKQHVFLRLLLKSGSINIKDRQAAISIADQQNDQESIAILNGK